MRLDLGTSNMPLLANFVPSFTYFFYSFPICLVFRGSRVGLSAPINSGFKKGPYCQASAGVAKRKELWDVSVSPWIAAIVPSAPVERSSGFKGSLEEGSPARLGGTPTPSLIATGRGLWTENQKVQYVLSENPPKRKQNLRKTIRKLSELRFCYDFRRFPIFVCFPFLFSGGIYVRRRREALRMLARLACIVLACLACIVNGVVFLYSKRRGVLV